MQLKYMTWRNLHERHKGHEIDNSQRFKNDRENYYAAKQPQFRPKRKPRDGNLYTYQTLAEFDSADDKCIRVPGTCGQVVSESSSLLCYSRVLLASIP
jgi:hypothetical protein